MPVDVGVIVGVGVMVGVLVGVCVGVGVIVGVGVTVCGSPSSVSSHGSLYVRPSAPA